MKNATQRKRLGYITEEQETAELLQQTNGGGGYNVQDPIRYAIDLTENVTPEIATDAAPINNSGDIVPDGSAVNPIDPIVTPTKTINWALLIAVAVGFYLITKKN